jgi:hypothetical protein
MYVSFHYRNYEFLIFVEYFWKEKTYNLSDFKMSVAVMSVSGQNWMGYFSYIVLYILRNFLQKYSRIYLKLIVSNSDKYYVCRESGGWSLAFYRRCKVSIPYRSM